MSDDERKRESSDAAGADARPGEPDADAWENIPPDDKTWTAHTSPLRRVIAWVLLALVVLGTAAIAISLVRR